MFVIFRHVGNDDIRNRSLFFQTIWGDQICVTYDPPGESDVTQGVEPVSTSSTSLLLSYLMQYCSTSLQLYMYINSSGLVDLFVYFHERTYTTFDRGGEIIIRMTS